jgi:probable F420-dependent oxidoreductase
MKYAVYLPHFGPYGDARVLADLARDAEQSGWDGFFIWDHIAGGEAWSDVMVDPWVALAAIAMQTARIRIGALVTPLPRRRPWKVARETVSVDHLSGGRLTFGVGIGNNPAEYDHLGEETDPKRRGAMLDEALTVLTGLWRGEPFSHDGAHYHVKDALFLPRPVQQPRIPIWVAGIWPNKAPLRRAIRWDGAFTLFRTEGEAELAEMRAWSDYLHSLGDLPEPFDLVYSGCSTPGDDPAQAAEIVARFAPFGFTWWLEMIAPWRGGKGWRDPDWPLDLMRQRILQGPPPYP